MQIKDIFSEEKYSKLSIYIERNVSKINMKILKVSIVDNSILFTCYFISVSKK
jgi:hypothetical protein